MPIPTQARTIDELIEQQALRWRLQRQQRQGQAVLPVVTISRQHGARGSELGRRLCEDLRFDLFDREIIHQVAEHAGLSERVVQTLDERDREMLTDWLLALGSPGYLSPASYRDHLCWVIGTIARHGGAVILGRGAHMILGARDALRVLVVAPLEARVAEVMRREALPERLARHRIAAVDGERAAFIKKHFHVDAGDPANFDVVVNTGRLGVDGALVVIQAALARLPGPG